MKTYITQGIRKESGLAYVAILALVAILSTLSFAFLFKAGTGTSATMARGKSMQAHYLAETAANHAMWRLLNEGAPKSTRVSHNDDDAEEEDDGHMQLDNDTPELGTKRYVGLRFLNVLIPQGVTILHAQVEFKASKDDNDITDLVIQGEDANNALRFTSSDGDISGRPQTAASVTWNNIPNWTKDEFYQTPDLASVIQEIVDQPGWTSGNAMAILFRSTDLNGRRRFYAHDKSPASTPVLIVEYGGSPIAADNIYHMHSLAGGRYGYKVRRHTNTTFATIATVGAVGDHEVHQSYVLYILPQTSEEHCTAEYVEMHQPWIPVSEGSWELVDLSSGPFYVPANAVIEVAITNADLSSQRLGGVRAVGSTLNRRGSLHEAEDGGVDALVMHVQANADSQIEYFAGKVNHIEFIFLGYWTCANYVETLVSFKAGASASWRTHNLDTYGVGPDQVAEVAITNSDDLNEWQGRARAVGSTLIRSYDLHEAEDGGFEYGVFHVQTSSDANATIEIAAASDASINFYLIGYWSTPPGVYTEQADILVSPGSDLAWEDTDLSGLGVPASAVVQIAMLNSMASEENYMGAREKGSALERTIDIHEAEAGGVDLATIQVNTDENSTVQLYHEDVSDSHSFYLTGYWECMDTAGLDLMGHWKLDEDSDTTASDSSSKGNDGTLTNMDPATDWVPGKIDGALDFDGDNDHIRVPYDPSLSLINQFTLAAWIYASAGGLNLYDLVLNKGTSGNNQNYWFGTVGDEISFGFYNGGFRAFNTSDVNLQTETWYHIAATFNNANDRVRVYLNGAEVKNWSTDRQPLVNTDDLYIGTSPGGADWNGKLDDVRIYNRVLSTAEISALFALGN